MLRYQDVCINTVYSTIYSHSFCWKVAVIIISRLQFVPYMAIYVVFCTHSNHLGPITPIWFPLHWLPVCITELTSIFEHVTKKVLHGLYVQKSSRYNPKRSFNFCVFLLIATSVYGSQHQSVRKPLSAVSP